MDLNILTFGKYKGKNLLEIAEKDPSYIFWLEQDTELIISDEILEYASENINLDVPPADIDLI